MHYIFTVFQGLHIVGIPLEHFAAAIKILGVVVRSSNRVFVDVCQLHFYPRGVVALFVQDGTHGMPETVPGYSSRISNSTYQDVHRHFAHWFTVLNPTRENEPIIAGDEA